MGSSNSNCEVQNCIDGCCNEEGTCPTNDFADGAELAYCKYHYETNYAWIAAPVLIGVAVMVVVVICCIRARRNRQQSQNNENQDGNPGTDQNMVYNQPFYQPQPMPIMMPAAPMPMYNDQGNEYMYGQPMMDAYGQPMMDAYGQPMNYPYGQPMTDAYGQPINNQYGQPSSNQYNQNMKESGKNTNPTSYPNASSYPMHNNY